MEMEEKRIIEILQKIEEIDSQGKLVNSKILAEHFNIPEEKMIHELEELDNKGYISTMPVSGNFKHLRVAEITTKGKKFLSHGKKCDGMR